MVIGVTLGTSVNLTDFDRDYQGNYRIDDMILSEDHLRLLFGYEQELERQGVYLKDKKYVFWHSYEFSAILFSTFSSKIGGQMESFRTSFTSHLMMRNEITLKEYSTNSIP